MRNTLEKVLIWYTRKLSRHGLKPSKWITAGAFISLVVKTRLPTQGVQVLSLAEELRSQSKCLKKKKKITVINRKVPLGTHFWRGLNPAKNLSCCSISSDEPIFKMLVSQFLRSFLDITKPQRRKFHSVKSWQSKAGTCPSSGPSSKVILSPLLHPQGMEFNLCLFGYCCLQ